MIYLLRHGEIEFQGEKPFVGQINLSLSEQGILQAQWWQKALAQIVFDQIYCSDLVRSKKTAKIIAGARQAQIQVMTELREIHLGEWDGVPMAKVRAQFPEKWLERGDNPALFRPPGGESFDDMHNRVISAFEQIVRQSNGQVLIVAHAGVNRVILCHILGMPLANLFRLGQDYGGLNIIDCKNNSMYVKAMNVRPALTREDYFSKDL